MKRTVSVIVAHLIFQLVYSTILSFWLHEEKSKSDHHPNYAGGGFVLFMAMAMIIHIFISTLLVFIDNKDDPELKKANLLGILITLLLGASICFSVPSIL